MPDRPAIQVPIEEEAAGAAHGQPGRSGPHASLSPALLHRLERSGLSLVLILLVVAFSVVRPETFPTLANVQTILQSSSVIAVAALAVLVPLVGGRFDISVGAVVGLTSIIFAACMSRYGMWVGHAAGIAILVGLLVGVVNGLVVTRLGVSSLIATLASATIVAGFIQFYTQGIPISDGLDPDFLDLTLLRIQGIPALFLIMLVVAILVAYVLNWTPFGRRLTAVGSNAESARLVGIPVERTVLLSFCVSGVIAAVGGVLQVAQQGSGNPQVGGVAFLLPALAAVFLGATTINPGHYNVWGTLLGLYFVAVIVSGLALLGAAVWVQPVFNGFIVIAAVSVSNLVRRKRTGTLPIGL